MTTPQHTKVLIIGSGPAGYTAAIYAARANLKPILVQGLQPGGQLTITTDVENYPGFQDAIQGPWLMEQMQNQARHVGAELIDDMIASIDFSQRPFKAIGDFGASFTADTVIIATGAQARWLNVPGEETYRGFGVSACATCDGIFFKDKKLAVVGGGNTAVEEALYLANLASEVVLIHRRDQLRADKTNQERLFAHPKITTLWNKVVSEVKGRDNPKAIETLNLTDTLTGQNSQLSVDGLFVAIGHTPMSSIFKGQLSMDEEGYLLTTPGSTVTNIPGVFAAGDVQDKVYRQAVTAAGQGCMAALEADRFLTHGQ